MGKYWRNNPLVFSFDGRCHGECASQKNTAVFVNTVASLFYHLR